MYEKGGSVYRSVMLLLMDICLAKYWLNVSAFSLSSEIKQLLYFNVGE
jgi:hypothetical protein